MSKHALALANVFRDPLAFSRAILHRPLRRYQVEPARAILQAVLNHEGGRFAVMMSRQSGKNETSAQLEALLLNLHRSRGGTIVKAAPTFRPQAVTSLRRLIDLHMGTPLPTPRKTQAYMIVQGRATISFFGAGENTSVVGATASLLLEGDEAQDINLDKWSKDFRPMAASTNAPTVLWGTAWTTDTLLAQNIADLQRLEAHDGHRRAFIVPWDRVADEVPAYGDYVQAEIARLGLTHPMIRTQYLLETIDDAAGMFPPATQRAMHGTHPRQQAPGSRDPTAFLIDVAGAQTGPTVTTRKDSTVLTIVRICQPAGAYHVLNRHIWTGIEPTALAVPIGELIDIWHPQHIVIDATGLGSGLASLLATRHPNVTRFIFTQKSKSDLGWAFLGLCNSGRFQDHQTDGGADQARFWRQVQSARYEVVADTSQLIRWSVPDPTVHDDELLSAALCAAIPDTPVHHDAQVIPADDPIHRSRR